MKCGPKVVLLLLSNLKFASVKISLQALENEAGSWAWWCKPVIPDTWETKAVIINSGSAGQFRVACVEEAKGKLAM